MLRTVNSIHFTLYRRGPREVRRQVRAQYIPYNQYILKKIDRISAAFPNITVLVQQLRKLLLLLQLQLLLKSDVFAFLISTQGRDQKSDWLVPNELKRLKRNMTDVSLIKYLFDHLSSKFGCFFSALICYVAAPGSHSIICLPV